MIYSTKPCIINSNDHSRLFHYYIYIYMHIYKYLKNILSLYNHIYIYIYIFMENTCLLDYFFCHPPLEFDFTGICLWRPYDASSNSDTQLLSWLFSFLDLPALEWSPPSSFYMSRVKRPYEQAGPLLARA